MAFIHRALLSSGGKISSPLAGKQNQQPQFWRRYSRTIGVSSSSSNGTTPFYSPTLTEKRVGEGGRGGRSSEAGLKVAVFGASGFLGNYVGAQLGTYAKCWFIYKKSLQFEFH